MCFGAAHAQKLFNHFAIYPNFVFILRSMNSVTSRHFFVFIPTPPDAFTQSLFRSQKTYHIRLIVELPDRICS